VALALAVLAGCAAPRPAPVAERAPPSVAGPPPVAETVEPVPPPPPPSVPTHTVKRGETLVSIALQYGLDYRDLAAWNNIANPARIAVGQVLALAAPPGAPAAAPAPQPAIVATPLAGVGPPIEGRPLANTPTLKVEPRAIKVPYSDKAWAELSAAPATPVLSQPVEGAPPAAGASPPIALVPPPAPAPAAVPEKGGTAQDDLDWMWPAKGKVLAPFTEASKGMDIAGKRGSPVLAAAAGRVIYADAGLRGYGKLVIIRHNDTWLSAYAHNDNILVKEQQEVRKGQKIAEMGSTDAEGVLLHFEIRRQGKPVDPTKYLPPM
jgi:lipoprotein NlpD